MMKLLWILLILFFSVILGTTAHQDAGYVFISLNHWTIECTVWVAAISLFLIFFTLHILLSIIHAVTRLPHRWSRWREHHRLRQAQKNTTAEQLNHQRETYLIKFNQLISDNDRSAIERLFKKRPRALKQDATILAAYARYLMNHDADSTAETLLRKSLRKKIEIQLLDLYGQTNSDGKQFQFAHQLLDHAHTLNPETQAAIYLCLARLCVTKQLWGKAKPYFEESIALSPTAKTYAEYGHLLSKMGDQNQATIAYEKGLTII